MYSGLIPFHYLVPRGGWVILGKTVKVMHINGIWHFSKKKVLAQMQAAVMYMYSGLIPFHHLVPGGGWVILGKTVKVMHINGIWHFLKKSACSNASSSDVFFV